MQVAENTHEMNCPLTIISNLDSQGSAVDLDAPAIYVASLSDYNAGILHGCWISCCFSVDHVWEEVNAMLATSPTARKYREKAEEWAIHTSSGFCNIDISESASFEHCCELAEALEEHGETFAAYYSYHGSSEVSTAVSEYEDAFYGVYDSEKDFAEQFCDDTLDIPEWVQPYFDYEAYARDMFLDSWHSVDVSNGIAVFSH